MKKITYNELLDLCTQNFYSNVEEKEIWYPFEYNNEEEIQEMIDTQAYALKQFLETKGIKVEDFKHGELF